MVKKQIHVHILAICGYATSGLALMAKDLGYRVTGSDEDAYPPNSTLLKQAGIKWESQHRPENLTKYGRPDLVILGNQIRDGNPEILEAYKLGLKVISDSEFFYRLTANRRRIVVCGSHGKTTTSALISWILEVAGRHPGFRLGTVVKNFKTSVRLGQGQEFVFEGDEYTTTFEDQRPKFFHFHPHLAIINNIEWDHPDVFRTRRVYLSIFKKYLVSRMSKEGLLVVNSDDKNVTKVIKNAPCRVVTYGLKTGEYQAHQAKFGLRGVRFQVSKLGQKIGGFSLPLFGFHNVGNGLAAIATCLNLKVPVSKIKSGLKTFQGTSRRFEIMGTKRGITVIDDYAHHPTKARETIAGARLRYPKARIFVVYVPHTFSRTKSLLKEYTTAFLGADFVIIPDIEPARERHLASLIHSRDLVSLISKKQRNVFYLPKIEEVVDFVTKRSHRGDVILCMSVRGFGKIAQKILKTL